MYALFSHLLLMPIIPMGQLNRKSYEAVKIDDCGNKSFTVFSDSLVACVGKSCYN